MAYFLCQDFSSGLDVRKSDITSVAGSLQVLDDGQITRGGEVEKRKAFTNKGDLLEATRALCGAKRGNGTTPDLIVFGNAPAPDGLPDGVVYQRLQHPDGGIAMVDVVDYTLFNGKAFVAADFVDGSQWLFYDGALVSDWGAGIVRAGMDSNDAIAEHMKLLVDASDSYSASREGSTVIITGPPGVDYTATAETQNGGVVNDQQATVSEIAPAIAGAASTKSVGEFAIILGENGSGNFIDQVRVDNNGVFTDLISSPVPFATTPELTALNVVNAINAGNGSHGYVASTTYGKVFVGAPLADGAGANGRVLEVVAKGAIVLGKGGFEITEGTPGAGNEITSVAYNGVAITSGPTAWATSHAATAAAVAANIRAFPSSPKMNAVALGTTCYVSPSKVRSTDASSISLSVTYAGTVLVGGGAPPPVEVDYSDYSNPQRPGFPLRQIQ